MEAGLSPGWGLKAIFLLRGNRGPAALPQNSVDEGGGFGRDWRRHAWRRALSNL